MDDLKLTKKDRIRLARLLTQALSVSNMNMTTQTTMADTKLCNKLSIALSLINDHEQPVTFHFFND